MSEQAWNAVKRLVSERAHGCCEYCQTCEANLGQAMHVEHIDPAGGDTPENLCLACSNGNLSKARVTTAVDPDTGQRVPLFNPRMHVWAEHFTWMDQGRRLHGLTAIGRATINRLKMNQERVLMARRRWITGGFHPPDFG